MSLRIAIHPDRVIHRNGEVQSFSLRWQELAGQRGIQANVVDAYEQDALAELSRHDAFMWRFPPDARVCRFAQCFLNSVEFGLRMPVFPDWRTRWHMEDKITQTYMIRALGIAAPETHVFWDRDRAIEYLSGASYPLVLKLASGFQSRNVRLLNDRDEALYFAEQLFARGLSTLAYAPAGPARQFARNLRQAAGILRGNSYRNDGPEREKQRGYLYVQEFVAGNSHDTRITVIGDRAFGFVRNNRPGDFRASGSGLVDWDPEKIDPRIVETAFRIADSLDAKTIAIDALRRGDEILILEFTLAFAGWAVRRCPGHWRRSSRDNRAFEWVEGAMNTEDAIFDDFVNRLDG